MLLRTVTAETMNAAMAEVKRIFGEEAIIVSSAKDAQTGKIRVTAALDKHPEDDTTPGPDHLDLTNPDIEYISPLDAVGEAFDAHGVPRIFGDQILREVDAAEIDDPVMALASVLESRYRFKPLSDGVLEDPLILVGPPGVGKTSLAGKIATRTKKENKECQIITADTIRAGAVEQLKSFTDALKLDLQVAHDATELANILKTLPADQLKIIDTVGTNPFDMEEIRQLESLIKTTGAEPVLVLSAGGDAAESGEIATIFKKLGVTRFMYTRLDISRKFASLLTIAEKSRLAFSEASISPLIAEGLNPLTPVGVSRIFLEND